MEIILASQSPRRRELLERMGIKNFRIVTPDIDEHMERELPPEELVRRILLRGKDSGRADDASEDVIRNHIKVYREQTEVVGAYYARQNKYFEVDGVGSMDEVFDRICRVVDARR